MQLFNRPGERFYIMVEAYSYELVCDPSDRRWHFESEYCMDEEDSERRTFEGTIAYPDAVNERVRQAAVFASAYFNIDVDGRIGLDAFPRVSTADRYQ